MNAPEEMALLLEQWHQMTRAETQAIQVGAWPKLQEIQSGKKLLQPRLSEALANCNAEQPPLPPATAIHPAFRAEVNRLIALEAHNAHLVSVRQRKLREQQRHLDRATRNLRKVRGTYAAQSSTALNCLS